MDYINMIKKTLEKHQVVFIWNNQNIDLFSLLFSKEFNASVINYSRDDILLTNYTKLLTFFGANKELKSFDERFDYDNFKFNRVGVFKTFLYVIKKAFYFITHRNYSIINKKFSNFQFSNQEINLIAKIKKFSELSNLKKTKIIVINNINFANENDIVFFKKLVETDFFNTYTPNIKVVFISSSPQILGINLDEIGKKNYLRIELSDDELCEYIKQNYKELQIQNVKLIQYLKLCNYDFSLINSIIENSRNQSIDGLFSENFTKLKRIVFNTLETRPYLSVLEIAAVIGLSFDIAILQNISEIEIEELVNRLNEAFNLGLLTRDNNTTYNYEFINNFIREIIYSHGSQQSTWHKKYAEKINSISPNEHALIAYHYQLGNEVHQAIYHYWAYLLVCAIDNKKETKFDDLLSETKNAINNNILWKSIYNYIIGLLTSFRENKLDKSQIINCFDVPNHPDNNIQEIEKFTKLYILYVGKLTDCEKEFELLGSNLEESYKFLKEKNLLGLQIRCALSLIDIYSYRLNKTEKAQAIKTELDNITSDILFNLNTNTLFPENKSLVIKIIRKTSMILNAELSFEKTKQILLSCFEVKNSLDEVELYKFISDHVGYALYSGNYSRIPEKIVNVTKETLKLSESLQFPKHYKLRMNYFLYCFFNGELSFSEITSFFKNEKKNNTLNSSMYKYDMAAIALYCAKYSYAEETLLSLIEELKSNNTCFYNYCYNSNLASLYILKKDYERAKYYNDKILNSKFEWYEDFTRIMKFRAEKFNEFIIEKRSFTPKQLFNCFGDIDMFCSSSWKFLGKGILFSELMFYRE